MKSARINAAIERALADASAADLLIMQLDRASGLPGARPNLDLARAAGAAIAAAGVRAAGPILEALLAAPSEYARIVAAQVLAHRAMDGDVRALPALQDLAEDPRRLVRAGAVEALRTLLALRGDPVIAALAPWMDGYLQAHIAIEALADRTLLARLHDGSAVLSRLDEAFALADRSPRSAERLQGVRLLRQALPAQIAIIAARFPEALAWLEAQTRAARPETRSVVARAIAALRRAAFPSALADRLAAALAATAPPPRDPTRIVQGTRRRGKGSPNPEPRRTSKQHRDP